MADNAESDRRNSRRSKNNNKPSANIWGWIVAALGLIGTIAGLALDIPELLGFGTQRINPAKEDEVLVIVADFTEQGVEADSRIYRALAERVATSELSNVRVERLEGEQPLMAQDAIALGEQYNATMVIWGIADSLSIEPHYELIANADMIRERPDPGIIIASEVPSFTAYVVSEAPQEFDYVMLFALGQMAFISRDYVEADALLGEALALDLAPARFDELNVVQAYLYRAYAAEEIGDSDSAFADYSRAIELDDSISLAYYNRGLIRYHNGDAFNALTDYGMAIEIRPNEDRYYVNRGLVYASLGSYAEALADYDAAIRLDDQNVNALNNRAYLRAENQIELDLALNDVNAALELEPERATFYDTRGFVYYQLGEYNAARADYQTALTLDPPELFATYGLALVADAQGDRELAITHFEQYLVYYPASTYSEYARERIAALRNNTP